MTENQVENQPSPSRVQNKGKERAPGKSLIARLKGGLLHAFALILALCHANDVLAGRGFDYIGYGAVYILESVANENDMAKDVTIRLADSNLCVARSRSLCSAINIRMPFDKGVFFQRAVAALAQPCAYAKGSSVKIKNPDLLSAKKKPWLDGKEFFCQEKVAPETIVLVVTDSAGVLKVASVSVVIDRN